MDKYSQKKKKREVWTKGEEVRLSLAVQQNLYSWVENISRQDSKAAQGMYGPAAAFVVSKDNIEVKGKLRRRLGSLKDEAICLARLVEEGLRTKDGKRSYFAPLHSRLTGEPPDYSLGKRLSNEAVQSECEGDDREQHCPEVCRSLPGHGESVRHRGKGCEDCSDLSTTVAGPRSGENSSWSLERVIVRRDQKLTAVDVEKVLQRYCANHAKEEREEDEGMRLLRQLKIVQKEEANKANHR